MKAFAETFKEGVFYELIYIYVYMYVYSLAQSLNCIKKLIWTQKIQLGKRFDLRLHQ